MLYQKTQIHIAFWFIISNYFNFFESLKIFSINMVATLMMSAKVATPGLLKDKIFRNKDYHFIVRDCEVTNKILLRDSNYIVDMVL